jgi:hypothetical protein
VRSASKNGTLTQQNIIKRRRATRNVARLGAIIITSSNFPAFASPALKLQQKPGGRCARIALKKWQTGCGRKRQKVRNVAWTKEKQKEYQKEYQRAYSEWAAERGVCVRCHKEPVAIGFEHCPKCLETKALYSARIGQTKEYRDYQRAYQKRRYAQLKIKGLCPCCGKRKPEGGFKLCGLCRNKLAARHREWAGKQPLTAAQLAKKKTLEQGLTPCSRCGSPVVPGKKYCKKCAEGAAENLRKVKNTRGRDIMRRLTELDFELMRARKAEREARYKRYESTRTAKIRD